MDGLDRFFACDENGEITGQIGNIEVERKKTQYNSKKYDSEQRLTPFFSERLYYTGDVYAEAVVCDADEPEDPDNPDNPGRDDDGKPPVKPDRDSDGKVPQRPDDGTPKTGDEMMFTLWMLICLGAGAGLFAASRKNHKE